MFGYRMSTSQAEQLYLRHLFADAMERRAPVEVTYFRSKKITFTRIVDGKEETIIYDGYVKTVRVVEPFALDGDWDKETHWVDVVDRSPQGAGSRPGYRRLRLDRIAVNSRTGKPLVRRKLTYGYLCPSRLDFRDLYPTKRVLAHA